MDLCQAAYPIRSQCRKGRRYLAPVVGTASNWSIDTKHWLGTVPGTRTYNYVRYQFETFGTWHLDGAVPISLQRGGARGQWPSFRI